MAKEAEGKGKIYEKILRALVAGTRKLGDIGENRVLQLL